MTQHEFQEGYAKITGFAWSQLEKYLQVAACNCGKPSCPGWQMITLPTSLPALQISGQDLTQAPRTHTEDRRKSRTPISAQM